MTHEDSKKLLAAVVVCSITTVFFLKNQQGIFSFLEFLLAEVEAVKKSQLMRLEGRS